MVVIKKLPVSRWKDYRDLRLEALKKDPTAFESSYEEQRLAKENKWKKGIRNVLFAMSNDKPIGMIVYVFEDKMKTRHLANIFGVYVKKEFRGMGIGRQLIESAISMIKQNKNIIKIGLTVNPKQKAALSLYKKFGFKKVGLMKKDACVNGKFYDELIMEKIF